MKPSVKRFLLLMGLYGSVLAIVMAAFDLAENKPFNLISFVFKFLFFGLFMALTDRFFSKPQTDRKAPDEHT